MNMHIKALCPLRALLPLASFPADGAQGPTFIDPVSVVESDNVDSVMVAEWLVTNATENTHDAVCRAQCAAIRRSAQFAL